MKHLLLLLALGCTLISKGQPPIDYQELTDTKPHDNEATWKKHAAMPQVYWGSTDIRYKKLSVPTPETIYKKALQLSAWRGEGVNAQAVLYTAQALNNVSLKAGPLTNGSYTIPSSAISTSFVRYVMTDELNKDGKGGCGHRKDRTQWDSSIVADALDARKAMDVEMSSTRPLWLHIQIPQDAQPGTYRGTLVVEAEGMKAQTLPYQIRVSKRVLAKPADWKFQLDLWQNPYAVARFYNVPLWSQEHFDLMRPSMKRLAEAGQKVITATVMQYPWNVQTEDGFESMVMRIRKMDGTWTYDYTVFDRWVEFMMSMGIDKQINCYTMIPWALKFDYIDQASNTVKYIYAKPGDKTYEDYWLNFLKDFASHLKAKGWFSRTAIAMDERAKDQMREAFKLIFKADPAYKVSGAGHYYAEIEPNMYELCMPYGQHVPDSVLARRRKEGKLTTVYTCCTEAYPNMFSFSEPAEATCLPLHAIAGNYDGYLRWAYNSWTKSPHQDSRFRSFAAGDCYIYYPVGSSIRLERFIEGIQYAEKIRVLRQEFQSKGEKAKLKALNEAIASFMPDRLNPKNAAEFVDKLKKLIEKM